MRFVLPLLALLLTATPALAAGTAADSAAAAGDAGVAAADANIDKKAEVPFREDSGLINAEYYLSTGKYAQALTVLAAVLKRHPQSADAYTYTGYAYAKLGDMKRATANYKKALEIDPTHLGANRYMAEIYLGMGDLQRAIEQMQVIRMTCAEANCEELDELESEINAYRKGQREDPAANGNTPKVKVPKYNYN